MNAPCPGDGDRYLLNIIKDNKKTDRFEFSQTRFANSFLCFSETVTWPQLKGTN